MNIYEALRKHGKPMPDVLNADKAIDYVNAGKTRLTPKATSFGNMDIAALLSYAGNFSHILTDEEYAEFTRLLALARMNFLNKLKQPGISGTVLNCAISAANEIPSPF